MIMNDYANKDGMLSTQQNILLIDDSKSQLNLLANMLEKGGHRVETAHDGLSGLFTLMSWKPNLIICDVQMPRMNGYEFCKAVKDDNNLNRIPVILLTSLSDMSDIIRGLNAGADYYITKPFNENFLLSMVDSIFSRGEDKKSEIGKHVVELNTGERIHTVTTSPQQILNFLFSTYENLLSQNTSLAETKKELKKLNDNLEIRIEEKTQSLKNILTGIVVALSTTVEMRDPYTAGHQSRVSQIACDLAKDMGLSEVKREGLHVMGLLHDIGKIIVPSEVLCKPSSLTDYEFEFIKAHSMAGFNIVKEIEFPWPVATGIVQHHERLNGSGYPFGLSDSEIILEAKILAVADVLESMASHRPYRPALGINAALEELLKHRGILYAPDVVDAAHAHYKDGNWGMN
jgi:putative two-component system response regulator